MSDTESCVAVSSAAAFGLHPEIIGTALNLQAKSNYCCITSCILILNLIAAKIIKGDGSGGTSQILTTLLKLFGTLASHKFDHLLGVYSHEKLCSYC